MCYRRTLVPVLPSMPWAHPQAAGCAGSHGSDCQDGHRGAEVIAVQGAEREKVTGGLLYRSCPRCRGHAHRLPAAPGAMDQTVRTAIEGRRSLRCKGTGKGENHRWTLVPVLPSMPWAHPQAAGCAGSRGSDCQDGHRGAEVIAVQGAEREKVTGGLLYPSYPRCRPWPSPAE